MANLLGNNLVVRIGDAITDPVLLCATSCTLNINQTTIEATCKGDGTSGDKWSRAIAASANWDLSTDGLYNPDFVNEESFDSMAKVIIDAANGTADNSVSVVFEIQNSASAIGDVTMYSGTAILTDVSLNGPVDEFATFTANFKGTGALVQTLKVA